MMITQVATTCRTYSMFVYSYTYVHLLVLATISNCSMHGHGSFKNELKCWYLSPPFNAAIYLVLLLNTAKDPYSFIKTYTHTCTQNHTPQCVPTLVYIWCTHSVWKFSGKFLRNCFVITVKANETWAVIRPNGSAFQLANALFFMQRVRIYRIAITNIKTLLFYRIYKNCCINLAVKTCVAYKEERRAFRPQQRKW